MGCQTILEQYVCLYRRYRGNGSYARKQWNESGSYGRRVKAPIWLCGCLTEESRCVPYHTTDLYSKRVCDRALTHTDVFSKIHSSDSQNQCLEDTKMYKCYMDLFVWCHVCHLWNKRVFAIDLFEQFTYDYWIIYNMQEYFCLLQDLCFAHWSSLTNTIQNSVKQSNSLKHIFLSWNCMKLAFNPKGEPLRYLRPKKLLNFWFPKPASVHIIT